MAMDSLLDRRCSDVDILEVSRLMTDWKKLAPYFNVCQPQVKEIEDDCKTDYAEQKRELLYKWRQMNGDEATIRDLCKRLKKAEERDLIHLIEQKYSISIVGGVAQSCKDSPTADTAKIPAQKMASKNCLVIVLSNMLCLL